MAKKVEELPPAPPLPGAPHTVHTDELVKALGANPVKGFTDAQAQELQKFVPLGNRMISAFAADTTPFFAFAANMDPISSSHRRSRRSVVPCLAASAPGPHTPGLGAHSLAQSLMRQHPPRSTFAALEAARSAGCQRHDDRSHRLDGRFIWHARLDRWSRYCACAFFLPVLLSSAPLVSGSGWLNSTTASCPQLALVVLNVTVGFTQEWKAEKTVAALASVGSPTAVVVRDGNTKTLAVEEVVP